MERHSSIGSLVLWGLIGGAIGGVLNVLLHVFALFGLGDPMAGDGGMGFMAIPVFLSFGSSVVPGAIAGLVYAALERLTSNPTSRFLQVSGAFLVVSLAGGANHAGRHDGDRRRALDHACHCRRADHVGCGQRRASVEVARL